jgi:glycosyltransferase involved in cell wall biosynthesis
MSEVIQATPRLSVVVITRNEAHHIRDCLASVAFADEWIVLDSGSQDETVAIAQEMGAQVTVSKDWPGFGPQKNRALALARGRWVLSLDADERVDERLALAIQGVIKSDAADLALPAENKGYTLARLSSFCGQWMHHGDWYPDRVLRLFQRDQARFSNDLVHERVMFEGSVHRLEGHLLHHTMTSLDDALDKMNRYSTGRAQDKLQQGQRSSLSKALLHSAWAFVRSYVIKRGFLDGRLGLVLAIYIAEGTYYRHLKMAVCASPASSGSK